MPAKDSQAWSLLKARLRELDKEELLLLLQQLYAESAENKHLIAFHCGVIDAQQAAEPYRKIIMRTFYPERGTPTLDLRAARKALSDFKRLIRDPAQVVDLMLFYVEQGAICTQTYGDINESFYRSITSVYTDAVRLAATINDPEVYEPFRPRFEAVIQVFANFGWGVYEYLIDVYYSEFPSEEQDPFVESAL